MIPEGGGDIATLYGFMKGRWFMKTAMERHPRL